MNFMKIIKYDIANGPGVRTTIFLSGCNLHCKGCFNKEAWSFSSGSLLTEDIVDKIIANTNQSHVNGISILGGEPFDQNPEELNSFLYKLRHELDSDKSIWVWSGHTYEDLIKLGFYNIIKSKIDVLVDGCFKEELYDPNLMYRGSSNQRVIDIQKSNQDEVVLLES